MRSRFRIHYTRAEADALLPQIRGWLAQIRELSEQAAQLNDEIKALLLKGPDAGGKSIDGFWRAQGEMTKLVNEFAAREIQIKDIERGLIDFPGFVNGREVFLCWEESESSVEFWHDIESGFSGREALE